MTDQAPTSNCPPSSVVKDTATAVIIGRAGSKGFPGKNSQTLLGHPIIKYSIEVALSAVSVRQIIVSTDCPNLAGAASRYSEVTLVNRPPELASDTTTVDAAVRHAVQIVQVDSPIIIILYANVPIRPAGLLDRAVDKLLATGADSVQSYASVGKYHPYWESRIDEQTGRIEPYFENTIYRRQDLPPLYIPDGGVIALRRESLFNIDESQPHAFLGNDRRAVINPHGSVIDIDEPVDLLIAESVLRMNQNREKKIAIQTESIPSC